MNASFAGTEMASAMRRRARGQVSTEILVSAIILMLVFVIVLLLIQQAQENRNAFQQDVQEQQICDKLSSIITYMSSNPPYTETKLQIDSDVNIVSGTIFAGDTICPFLGNVQNAQLARGIVKSFDVNGLIVFTNDLNYNPLNPPAPIPNSNANINGGPLYLIDDQNQIWYSEVQYDDTSYAVSTDDQLVDPDWVEFRFGSLGLTSADAITDARVFIKHFESNLIGLTSALTRVQCWNGSSWLDVNAYVPSYTETTYSSGSLASCITDYNLANNARIRMTYEPSGVGSTISLDYARFDANFLFSGQVVDLWERRVDAPQPLDFSSDVNSTANTFDSNTGNDGWDWNRGTFGGIYTNAVQINADPNNDGNISDSNVHNDKRLEIRIGGGVPGAIADPDDNAIVGPAASGAYGIQFDINSTMWSRIQGGGQLLLSFVYGIDADAGWGNALDAGEKVWVKARIGKYNNLQYLGNNLDAGDPDADTNVELYWTSSPTDYQTFYTQDVSSKISGVGTYYLVLGGSVSDWDFSNEGAGIYFDNINLVVT